MLVLCLSWVNHFHFSLVRNITAHYTRLFSGTALDFVNISVVFSNIVLILLHILCCRVIAMSDKQGLCKTSTISVFRPIWPERPDSGTVYKKTSYGCSCHTSCKQSCTSSRYRRRRLDVYEHCGLMPIKIPKKLITELIFWEIKNTLLTKLLQVLGDTMARCYIKFETMQKLSELQKETSLQELVISTWRHI